jgi:hypothetical protein
MEKSTLKNGKLWVSPGGQPNHQSLVAHSTRLVKRIKKKIPMAASHLDKVRCSHVNSFRRLQGALGSGLV